MSQENALIEEAFNLYDREGKGYITSDLLGVVLRSIGKIPSQKEVKMYVQQMNQNQNGKVSLQDLKNIASKCNRTVTDDQIRAAYKVFDRDNKGFIKSNELIHILTTVGEKLDKDDVVTMIKQVGATDGKIKYAQFEKIMKGL